MSHTLITTRHKMLSAKLFIVGTLVMTIAAEESPKTKVETITEKSFVNENGYNFEFQTSDGTSRKEEGELITVGEAQGIGVKGSYSFVAPDGQQYDVDFTADDKGFNPQIHVKAPPTQ